MPRGTQDPNFEQPYLLTRYKLLEIDDINLTRIKQAFKRVWGLVGSFGFVLVLDEKIAFFVLLTTKSC